MKMTREKGQKFQNLKATSISKIEHSYKVSIKIQSILHHLGIETKNFVIRKSEK